MDFALSAVSAVAKAFVPIEGTIAILQMNAKTISNPPT
jgi:hypothetical protein